MMKKLHRQGGHGCIEQGCMFSLTFDGVWLGPAQSPGAPVLNYLNASHIHMQCFF